MTNPVIDCLMNHRSVRKYSSKPIEPDKLETILTAGTRAATAGNLQFYSFVVVDDDEKKKELDRAWEPKAVFISKAPVVIIALVDQYRVRRWLKLHSDRDIHNNRPINFFLGIWDALIALQNMVIAAESFGMGTCYIGSILEMNIAEILGVPKHVFPAGLVCIGYPEATPKLSMRLPLDAVVHRNSYRMPTDDDINRWYAERDKVWDKVSEERKEKLKGQNIHSIGGALAVQRYSAEVVEQRSRGILDNLRRSEFDLTDRE